MPLSFGMDAALSGLAANQKALEVTGHNVANLATAGYARQSVIMSSSTPLRYGNWYLEMGCDVEEIRQIRHTFNDNIYRTESNNLGYWESRSKAVEDVEAILGEPMKKGFQTALNNFWDAFQELSKAPESLTIRALVKQRSDALVNHLNQVGNQLNKLQTDLNTEIGTRIGEVNDITEQIADLNVKIMSAEAAGNKPNDYYDQRNVLADRLSKLVDAETWITQEGSMDILVGGYSLVSKGNCNELVASPNGSLSHFYTPMLRTSAGNISIDVGQGIIKGLLEARGEVSGAKGSYENGTPNTTADITIAIDSSVTDPFSTAIIDDLKKELESRGLDYRLRFVDVDDLGDAVEAVKTTDYADDVNKYLVIFTGDSLEDDGAPDDATISGYLNDLKNEGVTVSVATDPANYTAAVPGGKGWDYFTGSTGGAFYSDTGAATTDYQALMTDISSGVNSDVNTKMASVPEDLNIISTVRKQLNALINIMAREVNRLHMSGKTLTGEDGGLFFEPIESTRPVELGNIKISDDLKDVNNIAASATDANGGNQIALAIANLRNANLMTGDMKVLSLDTYYQNIILYVGNKGYEAENMVDSHKNLVEQVDSMRQSVMGVSLDEEMTNMIKFKYAYNANSRVISIVDEMLETLLFRLGA